jgi:alkylation response protein AidB-like acyl-CoA dehydrogenase
MINFQLSDEQKDFRALAHTFAEREMRPAAAEHDEAETFAWGVLRKAQQVGLMSYFIPEEYGGAGVTSHLTACIISEELFWGCAGMSTAMMGSFLAGHPILLTGTEDQKARFLPRFTDPGQVRLGAFALTEPGAGSDAASIITTARRDGDAYLLNGRKCFITNGGIADVYVVLATVDRSAGVKGITAFVVPGDAPGLTAGKKERKMGIRASHTGDVLFEDVRVPVGDRLGGEGEGFSGAMRFFDHSRSVVASAAVGIARAALEYARDYALQRQQFGRPIARQEAVAFMLAEMATAIDAARLLTWRAAWLADAGLSCTHEAAMAKSFAGQTAMRATTDAVQILGGYGYMRDLPVEKWMRDAKVMQIYEGTEQIQQLIIARHLLEG